MGISACEVGKMEVYCVDWWKFGKGEALQMKNEVWRMKIEICERGRGLGNEEPCSGVGCCAGTLFLEQVFQLVFVRVIFVVSEIFQCVS